MMTEININESKIVITKLVCHLFFFLSTIGLIVIGIHYRLPMLLFFSLITAILTCIFYVMLCTNPPQVSTSSSVIVV
jgi:hypothetical protein